MIHSDMIMDYDRRDRCGVEEAVFCAAKTVEQIQQIIVQAVQHEKRLLLTRLDADKFAALPESVRESLQWLPVAQCAILGEAYDLPAEASVAVVSGGSSDAPVCHEIQATLNYHGIACDLFQDVGVAAMWRLLNIVETLQHYDVIIAVAGMEAALPTVLAGLVDAPIIAVPTSVGYGVAEGGQAALMSCLASCSGGIMTMNIDNGYGAACAAIKIFRKIHPADPVHK